MNKGLLIFIIFLISFSWNAMGQKINFSDTIYVDKEKIPYFSHYINEIEEDSLKIILLDYMPVYLDIPFYAFFLADCLKLGYSSPLGSELHNRAAVRRGGKSGLHRVECQVMPGGREPTESAAERRPPSNCLQLFGKGERVR